ncbi:MAG: Epsin-3, clathrin recruitment and traffic between the Golgi and endosome [Chrysothrix sp. TS-e1954]|nr:MAG: Epsin-3, clathrin recruitment and traffic between the Golgi and endosome [Chrysothrix sp. TS-e1954]
MDLDSLKTQVSNLTLYDVKAGFRKAQNAVMNYTEIEAKVREATNNEPWGASTSAMQEIANGTFNYMQLNEIMPMIYKRFTEKSAEEWRQIYKALQLLEFLIKNGSERVIDDARSHMSLLKMLRQFHYIDPNGKDQGINVRNRSKELAELLSDVDRIRQERKKARSTRNKYGGVEGGAGLGGASSSSGRYGGFGSETGGGYGGYSGGVYGDGGGFGGQVSEYGEGGRSRQEGYDEYDEYDEGAVTGTGRRKADAAATTSRTARKTEAPKPKEPEVDLFEFGDDDLTTSSTPAVLPTSNGKSAATTPSGNDILSMSSGNTGGDDDFDDFQSATTITSQTPASSASNIASIPPPGAANTTQFASRPSQSTSSAVSAISSPPMTGVSSGVSTPSASSGPNYSAYRAPAPSVVQPVAGTQKQNTQTSTTPKPTSYQAAAPNYFGSVSTAANTPSSGAIQPHQAHRTGGSASPAFSGNTASKPKASSGADPFASLGMGAAKKGSGATQKGPTMADMAKQKASAGIWGANAPPNSQQKEAYGSGGDLDLM